MSLNSFLMDETLEPQPEKLEVKAFEDTAPGEAPELREDITLIATLEALAIDLDGIESSIRASGGMSRSIALEAHVVMPSFLTGDYASGFFTEQPTKVGLTYAMESIDEAKTSMFTKIKEAFAKLIAWMIEKFKAAKEWFDKLGEKTKAGEAQEAYVRWSIITDPSRIAGAQAALEKNQVRYRAKESLSKYVYSERDKEIQNFVVANADAIIEARVEKAIEDLGANKVVLSLVDNWQEHNKLLRALPQYTKTISGVIADLVKAVEDLSKPVDLGGWAKRMESVAFPNQESVPQEKAAFKNAGEFETFIKAVSNTSYDNAYWDATRAVFGNTDIRLDRLETTLDRVKVESDVHGVLAKIRSFVFTVIAPKYGYITKVLKDSSDVKAAVVVAIGKRNILSDVSELVKTPNYAQALALCKVEFNELSARDKDVIKEIIVCAYDDSIFASDFLAGHKE